MKQNRFKFGDKVTRKYPDGSNNTFIVKSIHLYDGKILYAEGRDYYEWYDEDTLEVVDASEKVKA